jgi:hypothetical protein
MYVCIYIYRIYIYISYIYIYPIYIYIYIYISYIYMRVCVKCVCQVWVSSVGVSVYTYPKYTSQRLSLKRLSPTEVCVCVLQRVCAVVSVKLCLQRPRAVVSAKLCLQRQTSRRLRPMPRRHMDLRGDKSWSLVDLQIRSPRLSEPRRQPSERSSLGRVYSKIYPKFSN